MNDRGNAKTQGGATSEQWLVQQGYAAVTLPDGMARLHSPAQSIQNIVKQLPMPNGGPRPTVEFSFVDSQSIFARACSIAPPRHFGIMMSDSIVYVFMDLIVRILAHPGCFQDVGSPEAETATEPTLERLFRETDALEHSFTDGYALPTPKCPVRRTYANILGAFAIRAVALHELAHVVQGHLLLPQDDLTAIDRRALEMAADAFAAQQVYEAALYLFRTNQVRQCVPSESVAISAAVRAITIAHLFHRGSLEEQPEVDEYPNGCQRLLAALALGVASVHKQKTEQDLEIDVTACYAAISAIVVRQIDREYVGREFLTPESVQLAEHWQVALRPKLLPLTFTGLATAGPARNEVFQGY